MTNLLFIDDDRDILEGLSSTIRWRFIGIKVVGTVENGIEALKFLENDGTVDIIVTDIRMQGMDGIELSKNVYEKYPKIKIIILSGYSEFSYAKAAMAYGVNSYLLKPVMIRELLEAVYNARKEIILREEKEEQRNKQIIKEIRIHQQKFLNKVIIKGLSPDEDIAEMLNKYHIVKHRFPYVLGYIRLYLPSSIEKRVLDENGIMEALECRLGIMSKQNYLLRDSSTEYYFILDVSMDKKNSLNDLIEWKNAVIKENTIEIMIGVSGRFECLYDLNKAHDQVLSTLKYAFVYEDRELYFYEDNTLLITNNEKCSNLKEITTQLYKNEEGINNDSLDKIFISLRAECICDENTIKDICVNILSIILKDSLQKNVNIYSSVYEKYIITQNEIKSCRRFSDLHRIMKEFFIYTKEIENNNKLDSKSRVVQEMKDYINNNYFKEFDIVELSNVFKRSPNYLSHLFSEINGETFSECLNGVRIEKSKDLLKISDYTLYRIAKDVGYNDERYFIKIFKRITGYTPTQYRNIITK